MLRPSHWSCAKATISCKDRRKAREVVEIWGERGVVRAHAGLPGRDGWEGTLDDLAVALDMIASAVVQSLGALTIDRLVPGKRYRVLESLQELREGAVVRFRGFDDVDNHYGRYVFETTEREEVAVSGDFSSPGHSPLGETHRYLAELPD